MRHPHGQTGHGHDRIIRWARLYDLSCGVLGRRGRRLRASFADLLETGLGDRVLDVGCGPGRLALDLVERVGPTGSVRGVDAGEEMVRRATAKAKRQGLPAAFQVAFAQHLPFGDASFDGVACILALHHVADDDQLAAVEEMYRVLRPGGRVLLAEFEASGRLRRWLPGGHHGGHQDTLGLARGLLSTAGFTDLVERRSAVSWLGTITGRKPSTTYGA